MSITSKADLLLVLENYTLEDKRSYLEDLLSEVEEEVDMALLSDKSELAMWKMSISLMIEQVLDEVETQISNQMIYL